MGQQREDVRGARAYGGQAYGVEAHGLEAHGLEVHGLEVHGDVADGWEPVRTAFARNFERRGERGAAVAVHHRGRTVVDLWAGVRDADGPRPGLPAPGVPAPGFPAPGVPAPGGPAIGAPMAGGPAAAGPAPGSVRRHSGPQDGTEAPRPWTRETAQVIRSATKGVAAACLLLLHQRGQLDLDAPVADYWPQFKAAGKERVTVRQALAHRAGVPALDTPLTPAQALDGVSGPRALAAQAPLFPPGAAHGYHAQTYSWLLGELVLRVSGRGIGEFAAEEIAGPLGLDLWLGLPAAERHRVGRIADVAVPEPSASGALRARPKQSVHDAYADPASLTRRAFGAISPLPDENDPGYLAGGLAASGGVATARALARCYAALIGDVEGGGRLFTPATAAAARTVESAGPDQVLVVGTRFGLGYMLHGPSSPLLGPASFGHPGRGGCLGFADPEHGVGFGYVTNGMQKNVTADPRAQALVRAVRECIR